MVVALAYNVKHGANNKVNAWTADATAGANGTLTGVAAEDSALVQYILTFGTDVIRNTSTVVAPGNTESQWINNNLTADTANPKCPTVVATFNTLIGIADTGVTAGNANGTATTEPYITIATAGTRTNVESTFCLLGSHTTLNDLVFEGMSGFVPGADDKDMDTATIGGVYFLSLIHI